MSFSGDVRSTGNFQELFGTLRRRVNKSEVSKDDLATLQHHVNNCRMQTDFVECFDLVDNDVGSLLPGPYDAMREPDQFEVKIHNSFSDILGDATKLDQTLNGIGYDSIKIADSSYTTQNCYYAIPDNSGGNWDWRVNFRPQSIKYGNSIGLNIYPDVNQFVYYSNTGGTDFDFITQNISLGFWIYLTDLSSTGTNRVLAFYRVDGSNRWSIDIDDSDNKLFTQFNTTANGAVKRQYDTPLMINNWYYISITWQYATPTLSLKVNNNADIISTKTSATSSTDSGNIYFGSYPGSSVSRDCHGYFSFPMYWRHSTVLTDAERTNLYLYNTRETTMPAIAGYAQSG